MEEISLIRVLLSFLVVVGLIGASALALKKWGRLDKWRLAKDSNARLKVLDVCYVDPKHKIVLISRDDTEHLLAISPQGTTVIETDRKTK